MEEEKKYTLAMPSKEFFASRCDVDDKEFGEFLYDMVVKFCLIAGEELPQPNRIDYQLHYYREASNGSGDDQSRYFSVNDKGLDFIHLTVRNGLCKAVEKYANISRREGQNLLVQLNNGKMTLGDFNEGLE